MSTIRKSKTFEKLALSNYLAVTVFALMIISAPFLLSHAFAQTDDHGLTLRASQQVYVPGEALEISGTAEPNHTLVVRFYDPAGVAIRIENIVADENGLYKGQLFVWPEPNRNLVFGTYTVEVLTSVEGVEPVRAEVTFTGGIDQGIDPARGHVLSVKLDAPTQVTVDSPFRIFVQVTFDGALVEAQDNEAVAAILGTSHIHSNSSTTILSDKFRQLHPGLFYADVALESEDAYIIHAAAFYRGFLAHDTRLIAVTNSSIATLQESVNRLNTGIDATNDELGRLQEGLLETRSALNDTKATITESTEEIGRQIGDAQQASGQINAFILPVLALISVIIALQISLFARIRASYR